MGKISICIPFHLRGYSESQAYAISFRHYASLPYTVHLCGSEGDASRNFASRFLNDTTHYVEVPQDKLTTLSKGDDTLRKKFNDSLATLPDSEWCCLCGADDIIPASFFEWLETRTDEGVCMAGQTMGSPMILIDLANWPKDKAVRKITLNYSVKLRLTGGVNAFSRKAMQKIASAPYKYDGCETGAELLFTEIGYIIDTPGYVVMPKELIALNPMRKIVERHPNHEVTREDREIVKGYLG
jgi:hypothetical protein